MFGSTWRATSLNELREFHLLPIAVVSFFLGMGIGLIAPVLPLYRRIFGLSGTEVGLLLASFSLGRVLFGPVGGILSDHVGARRVVQIGCSLTGLASVAAGLTSSFALLVIAVAIQGIGVALYMTAAMHLVIAVAPERRPAKVIATYQGILLLGFSFGPILGGISAAILGPKAPFFIYAAMACCGLLVSTTALQDKQPEELPEYSYVSEYASIGRHPRPRWQNLYQSRAFMLSLVAAMIVAWVSAGIRSTMVPLFATTEMGFDSFHNGVLLTVSAMAQLVVLKNAGHTVDKVGPRPIILGSVLATGFSVALLALGTEPWVLFVAMALLGASMGYAAVGPILVVLDVVDRRLYGTGVGVQRMTIDLGKLIGPVSVGILVDALTYRQTFIMCSLLVAGTAICLSWLPDTRKGAM